MHVLLAIGVLFGADAQSFAQQCKCPTWPMGNEAISCKPITMRNGARLYWQFNCDSSWLTFRSPTGKKRRVFTNPMPDLTGRIGLSFAFENDRTFTLRNRVISGCCAPEQYILYSKSSGRELQEKGFCIWLSQNRQYNFLVRFADARQHSLMLDFLDTPLRIRIPLSASWRTRGPGPDSRPELAFFDPRLSGRDFSIFVRYSPRGAASPQRTDTIRYRLPYLAKKVRSGSSSR